MKQNLFPQDTRIIELVSAWSLLFIAVSLMFSGTVTESMAQLHPPGFWSVLLMILGFLQFFSLIVYPHTEALRIVMSLTNGSFWVWVFLSSSQCDAFTAWLALCTGLSNLYSFSIGFLLQRAAWRN